MSDLDAAWMSSKVRKRGDRWPVWRAFRRHVGIGWTGQREIDFVAGWDAAWTEARLALSEIVLQTCNAQTQRDSTLRQSLTHANRKAREALAGEREGAPLAKKKEKDDSAVSSPSSSPGVAGVESPGAGT